MLCYIIRDLLSRLVCSNDKLFCLYLLKSLHLNVVRYESLFLFSFLFLYVQSLVYLAIDIVRNLFSVSIASSMFMSPYSLRFSFLMLISMYARQYLVQLSMFVLLPSHVSTLISYR